MTIDVIIPTCKRREELVTSHGEDVVDVVHRTAGCETHIIPTCMEASASVNRNFGLKCATSDVRIMMDDDVEGFPYGWVRQMYHLMRAYPSCVMLTPELAKADGGPGPMMGDPPRKMGHLGLSLIPSRRIISACIAIRKWPDHIRFNEAMQGSGWEDDDICAKLRAEYPDGSWMICHDLIVVHRNEMKNQRQHFASNRKIYESMWGPKRD